MYKTKSDVNAVTSKGSRYKEKVAQAALFQRDLEVGKKKGRPEDKRLSDLQAKTKPV